jgi:hypothetical protein
MGRRLLGGATAAVLLGALGFVAAGCGSTSKAAATTQTTSTTTTSTTATGTNRGAFSADFQKYQSCLKSHGVTLPSFTGRPGTGTNRTFTGTNRTFTGPRPGGGGGGGGGGFAGRLANLTPAQRKAAQACQKLLPTGGGGGTFRARGGGGQTFSKYTACLKQHGVTFGGANQSTSKFAKAQAACKSLLPKPGATPTTTTATG